MNKLQFINRVTIPKAWHEEHVMTMVETITEQGFDIDVLKSITKKVYQLRYKKMIIDFSNAKEICEFMLSFFLQQKQNKDNELIRKYIEKKGF